MVEFILKLVKSVEKRRCLWDPQCKDYSRRNKLEKAWQEVSKEVEKPDKICREKWKNVRTGFMRTLKEGPPNGSGGPNKNKVYYLYDAMQFLLPYATRAAEQTGNLTNFSEKKILRTTESDSIVHEDGTDNESSSGSSTREDCFLEEVNTAKRFKRVPPKVIEKKMDADTEILNYMKERRQENLQSKEEADLMSFFKGITADVLSLSSANQRYFKRKLTELIDVLHTQESSEPNTLYLGSNTSSCMDFTSTVQEMKEELNEDVNILPNEHATRNK